ncbi:msr8645 [Mesorhizobium japonicum MAFF 303099]|uniref:Msr8645 protein n=1 Tax=Mesorhizobium japonicum (strain LMG 29417 / CECT 9101 / MAFF 303099) TaxID=266835 RepID=Q98F80_RHILO|nr:msr8645 [Mesorhizobium japonicum MAFF 303099]
MPLAAFSGQILVKGRRWITPIFTNLFMNRYG